LEKGIREKILINFIILRTFAKKFREKDSEIEKCNQKELFQN